MHLKKGRVLTHKKELGVILLRQNKSKILKNLCLENTTLKMELKYSLPTLSHQNMFD